MVVSANLPNPITGSADRTKLALLLITLSAICLSPQALIYDFIDSDVSPWAFSSLVMLSTAAGLTIFVIAPNYKKFLYGGEFAVLVKGCGWLTSGAVLWEKPAFWGSLAMAGQTSFGFFYLSASYSDIAITETLLALFPVFAVLIGVITPRLLSSKVTTISLRERHITRSSRWLMVTVTIGAGFVILSQSLSGVTLTGQDWFGSVFGVMSAFTAGVGMYSQIAFGESMLLEVGKIRTSAQMLTLAAFMTVCVRMLPEGGMPLRY